MLILSETQAIAFRSDGRVLNTADAGLTWTDRGIAAPDGVVNWAVVAEGTAVLVSGGGDVWRTADGGATWTETLDGLGDLPDSWGVSFLNEQQGWIAGVHGLVFETTDGGITWHSLNSGNGAEINDIEMFDSQRGLAVGINGYLFRTDNAGARWNVDRLKVTGVVLFRNENLNAVDIVDDQFAVTVGDDGVAYKTADGGLTWTSIGFPNLPEAYNISDVHFLSRDEGWVVGQDLDFGHFRTVYHTLDGGQTWTRPFDDTASFSAVDFEGERGWIATLGSRFLRSTDGGATWTEGFLPDNALASNRHARHAVRCRRAHRLRRGLVRLRRQDHKRRRDVGAPKHRHDRAPPFRSCDHKPDRGLGLHLQRLRLSHYERWDDMDCRAR